MTSERGLPAQRMHHMPKPDEQGELIAHSQHDDYPEDELDQDDLPGAECSSYIPRYATT
jgi:hypothetical protein